MRKPPEISRRTKSEQADIPFMETTLDNRSALDAILRGERTATPPPKPGKPEDSGAASLIQKHLEWGEDCITRPGGSCIMTEQDAERLVKNPPLAVVKIKGVRTGTSGDLSLIFGGAKSRKTSLAIMMAKELLAYTADDGREERVVTSDIPSPTVAYFDTEQSHYHSARMRNRITEGLPASQKGNLAYMRLREENNKGRLFQIVEHILENKPNAAFIDGVADLVTDTNNNTESSQMLSLLMELAEKTGTHIIAILHNTESNVKKGRGHLGSEYERKAETVYMVEKAKDMDSASVVTAQHTRNAPFESFHISHTSDGRLELYFPYEPPRISDGDMCKAMLDKARSLHPDKSSFTKNQLEEAHAIARKELGGGDSLSEKQFRTELHDFISQGFLEEVLNDKGKSRNPKLYRKHGNGI